MDLIWKISDNPILCFDGDEAGKKASKRISDIALRKIKPGKTLRFINLDNNYDPDDYVRSKGIDGFKDLLNNPTPMNKEIWNNVTNAVPKQSKPKNGSKGDKTMRNAKKINTKNNPNLSKEFSSRNLWTFYFQTNNL